MLSDANLETFWISFPNDPNIPLGLGVTAYSLDDAFSLIRERGLDAGGVEVDKVRVKSGVKIEDLDQRHVAPNIGPMQLRGVWYPAYNVGFGAPPDRLFKPTQS